jgi:hypothetical protein
VVNVVHTAGLSPVQAFPRAILAVDLVGAGAIDHRRSLSTKRESGQAVPKGFIGLSR